MASYTVQLENAAAIPLAVIRRVTNQNELSKVVPERCGLVWSAMKEQGVKAGRHVAIYWNSDIRLDVGVEVEGPFTERDPVISSSTPAGVVAFASHFGPYGGLASAHRAIRDWCKANGQRLAGPNWEIYGHWQPEWNTNPALIRTDVFYQIAP